MAARTLMEHAVARQGIRRGASVVSFILSWAIASDAMEKPLTLEEYATWWKTPRTTAFREQARFRETFPGHATPQGIVDAIFAEQDARQALKSGIQGIGAFPASRLAAAA